MKKRLSTFMAVLLCLAMMAPSTLAASFDDTQGHWAEESIKLVADMGLFQGNGTSFSPSGTMTRGMFVTVLGRMAEAMGMDVTPENEVTFSDVSSDAYYADYVAWAHEQDIVNGISDDTFSPSTAITREQMCSLFVRFLTAIDFDFTPYEGSTLTFLDQDSISSYAVDDVAMAVSLGLISGIAQGDDLIFNPKESATRAAVATVFSRLIAIEEIAEILAEVETEDTNDSSGSSSSSNSSSGSTEVDITADLEELLSNYQTALNTSGSDLDTASDAVKTCMADLMDCIQQSIDDGTVTDSDTLKATYPEEIASVKSQYDAFTTDERTEFLTIALDFENTKTLLELFGY